MSAWAALQRGDEVKDLRPWLHRIVHRCALNLLRMSGYDSTSSRRACTSLTERRRSSSAARWSVRRSRASRPSRTASARRSCARPSAATPRRSWHRPRGLGQRPAPARAPRPRVHPSRRDGVHPAAARELARRRGARSEPFAERIAKLTAGAASAGWPWASRRRAPCAGIVAGGALSTPAVVDRVDARAKPEVAAAAASRTPAPPRRARLAPVAARPRPASPVRNAVRASGPVRLRAAPPVRRDRSEADVRNTGPRGKHSASSSRRRGLGRAPGAASETSTATGAAAPAPGEAADRQQQRDQSESGGSGPGGEVGEADDDAPAEVGRRARSLSPTGRAPLQPRLGLLGVRRRRRIDPARRHSCGSACRSSMKKLLLISTLVLVAAASLVSAASAKSLDGNHDGLPDRWKRHRHLSLKVKQAKRDQDPRRPQQPRRVPRGNRPARRRHRR